MLEVTRERTTDGFVELRVCVADDAADAVEAAIRTALDTSFTPEEVFGTRKASRLIRGGRVREGWTQTELARRLGISKTVVSDLENGRRPVSKKMAVQLGEVFGSSPLVFLAG